MNLGRLNVTAPWIVLCAWASLTGSVLSSIGVLNGLGWAVAILPLVAVIARGVRVDGFLTVNGIRRRSRSASLKRRFLRPLPAIFLLTSILSLIGGGLYAPNNYDALTYRLPRMLHWLAEGRWHWIATPNDRMNYAGTGFEWLQAPIFLLTNSDRALFLLNIASFAMLPGLIFGVFRGLGVAGRVAWFWMWFLPVTYGFALQAGTIGNDSFSAVFALAGVQFALSAGRSDRQSDLMLSLIAAALLTGVKASNLPLVLPVLVAAWPVRGLLRRRPLATLMCAMIGFAVSLAPIAWANQVFTGHWSGDPRNASRMRITNPLAGVVGNSLQLVSQSLSPPVFPLARKVEAAVSKKLPQPLTSWLKREFPRFSLRLGELPQEESSGFGLGCSLLLLALLANAAHRVSAALASRRNLSIFTNRGVGIGFAALISTVVFMAKLGSEATARLLGPYYPFWILLLVLAPGVAALHRRRWWKFIALGSAASTLLVLMLAPSRPLLPMGRILNSVTQSLPGNAQIERARTVYAVYGERHDMLVRLRNHLPDDAVEIAMICDADDSELSLWMPYGRRRVINVTEDELRRNTTGHSKWLVVKSAALHGGSPAALDSFVAGLRGARLAAREMITSKVSAGPEEWVVIELPDARSIGVAP